MIAIAFKRAVPPALAILLALESSFAENENWDASLVEDEAFWARRLLMTGSGPPVGCNVPYPYWIGDGFCDGGDYNTEVCAFDGGDCCNPGLFGPYCNLTYPGCEVEIPNHIGNGVCDFVSSTEVCGFDGGDCCRPGFFGPSCNLTYPGCEVFYSDGNNPQWIANDLCDGGVYSTEACGFDGGDCCSPGFFGPSCNLTYPGCEVFYSDGNNPEWIGNGFCNGGVYSTEACGFDGGDCCSPGFFGPSCNLTYPGCKLFYSDGNNPHWIGDGYCNGGDYNTEVCGFDGGDCCRPGVFGPFCSLTYPDCKVDYPEWIADGFCDNSDYNTETCGFDGGDCCSPGFFGPSCNLTYPGCEVFYSDGNNPQRIGDGNCNGGVYNTELCEFDGGDCCRPGFFGPFCSLSYPGCKVDIPNWIGNGWCDGGVYNTEECGLDGGDCCNTGFFGPFCNLTYPGCDVDVPEWIGNGNCDIFYNTTLCGYDGGDCL